MHAHRGDGGLTLTLTLTLSTAETAVAARGWVDLGGG